jgi:hypothetical protein
MPDPCLLITRQKGCADGGAVARYQISDMISDIPAFVDMSEGSRASIISDL